MSQGVIIIEKEAIYSGYGVTFTYDGSKYCIHTKNGIRGKSTIFLISIDSDNKTYKWKYLNDSEVIVSGYKEIEKKM